METSSLAGKMTSRFVAGKTLADGLAVARNLDAQRILTTLDHLGENVSAPAEAAASQRAYLEALTAIAASGLPATVSVKLTQLGLDFSTSDCEALVTEMMERAGRMGSRVEIDMEDSSYVDRTLGIVSNMQARFGCARSVIQAYLYRSERDVAAMCERGVPVRLCKGAYREPAEVAFPEKRDVDANYVKLMFTLLEHGAYPALATHDERIIRHALDFIGSRHIAADRFEFQMLYGVRRDLQTMLVKRGYRVRLYVPYGDAWYPYFMRRLAERPANAIFLARNLMRS
jgi:proline dehydrogenase